MRLRLSSTILGLGLLLLTPTLSRADALYTYTLNIQFSSLPSIIPSTVNWSFDVSSILMSDTTIPVSSLLSESLGGVLASDGCSITSANILSPTTTGEVDTEFSGSGCPTTGFTSNGFAAGTMFTSYGTYTTTNGQATLVISQVPEPSSLILLGIGLVVVGGLMKRKRMALRLPQAT